MRSNRSRWTTTVRSEPSTSSLKSWKSCTRLPKYLGKTLINVIFSFYIIELPLFFMTWRGDMHRKIRHRLARAPLKFSQAIAFEIERTKAVKFTAKLRKCLITVQMILRPGKFFLYFISPGSIKTLIVILLCFTKLKSKQQSISARQ